MTTATINKPNAEWSNLFRDELLGESMENIVDRFVAHDNRRLDAAYKQVVQEHVYQHEMGNDFARAVLIAGDKGPRAVIAEFWAQIAKVNLVQMLDAAEKSLEDDDTPSEPPAPVTTNGHHAQEDAADDEEEDTDEADDDPTAIGKDVTDAAIPKARAIVAALQVVDGLPLWDEPDAHNIDDAGFSRAVHAVGDALVRTIDKVTERLPLSEQGRMLKLVMEQAGPYIGREFKVMIEGEPFDYRQAIEVLTSAGNDTQALIETLGVSDTVLIEIEDPIAQTQAAFLEAMPLEARARVYKLVHARALQWRESVARKAGKSP